MVQRVSEPAVTKVADLRRPAFPFGQGPFQLRPRSLLGFGFDTAYPLEDSLDEKLELAAVRANLTGRAVFGKVGDRGAGQSDQHRV